MPWRAGDVAVVSGAAVAGPRSHRGQRHQRGGAVARVAGLGRSPSGASWGRRRGCCAGCCRRRRWAAALGGWLLLLATPARSSPPWSRYLVLAATLLMALQRPLLPCAGRPPPRPRWRPDDDRDGDRAPPLPPGRTWPLAGAARGRDLRRLLRRRHGHHDARDLRPVRHRRHPPAQRPQERRLHPHQRRRRRRLHRRAARSTGATPPCWARAPSTGGYLGAAFGRRLPARAAEGLVIAIGIAAAVGQLLRR